MSYSIRIKQSAPKALARINRPERQRIVERIDQLRDNPGAHVRDQKRKPSNNPTLRWVFQNFAGLSILVTHSRVGTTMAIQNVGESHLRVLRSMGSAYEKIHLSG